MQTFLVVCSVALALISPVFYILSMIKGVSKPHRITRLVIFVAAAVSFVSLVADKSGSAVWLAGVFTLRSAILLGFSMKYGVGGRSKLDIACLILAVLGIIGWQITSNPMVALLASILADAIGYFPALVKTWKDPTTETPKFYILESLAVVANIAAIAKVSKELIFPGYILISNLLMLYIIYTRKPTSNIKTKI